MKRLAIALCLFLSVSAGWAQSGMTDNQIIDFVVEQNAQGVPRQKIVQQLMQRGVKVDQIRRMRDQYQDQLTDEGNLNSASEDQDNTRLNANNDGTEFQQMNTAKLNTTGEIYMDADEEHDNAELDV